MKCGRSPGHARRSLAAFVALAALAPLALPGAPTLHGVVVEGNDVWLSLHDTGFPRRDWVKVGGDYHEYRVERWDVDRQIAVLRRREKILQLPLAAGAVALEPPPAGSGEAQGILDNLRRLTVSACQHLLEQGGTAVTSADLVGSENALMRLESVAGESYEAISFVLEHDGLKVALEGASVPVLAAAGPLLIQVAPTQSLTAIGRRLRIPLEELQRLNPLHAATDRIDEWTSVRLH